ncbi:hypothetical protein MLD38_005721 [Melastoma candidum]|uniref:Uncharacterized protein n=1 Tax=Melastoma candidum TaxID=119954 RepID=A0ACB9RLR9_9MYRT|nr:hypothetical protein MLD38_005721 [Melastoma candidum]
MRASITDCVNKSRGIETLHSRSHACDEKSGQGGPYIQHGWCRFWRIKYTLDGCIWVNKMWFEATSVLIVERMQTVECRLIDKEQSDVQHNLRTAGNSHKGFSSSDAEWRRVLGRQSTIYHLPESYSPWSLHGYVEAADAHREHLGSRCFTISGRLIQSNSMVSKGYQKEGINIPSLAKPS